MNEQQKEIRKKIDDFLDKITDTGKLKIIYKFILYVYLYLD